MNNTSIDSKKVPPRPRPDHVIPERMLDTFALGFPKKNVQTFSTGVTVKWNRTRWGALELDLKSVQQREVFVAMYMDEDLIGAANIKETRNPSEDYLYCNDYYTACDAHSDDLMKHANVVNQVLSQFSDNEKDDQLIAPKEAFAEISSLWISPSIKSKLLWVLPLKYIITKLYKSDENYSVVILKPFPLEYSHHEPNIASENKDHYRELRERRVNALKRMYEKHLDFKVVDEADSWMAQVVTDKCRY